jgi:hypothetical protein
LNLLKNKFKPAGGDFDEEQPKARGEVSRNNFV